MRALIETNKHPTLLKVRLYSEYPCILRMKGFDSKIPDSVYFNRGLGTPKNKFVGEKEFCFPMPLSPKRLIFEASCDNKENKVEIIDIKQARLKQADYWLRPDDEEFVKFATEFSVKSSYAPIGMYELESEAEKGRRFILMYADELDGNDTTPARISRTTGIIEINRQKFLHFSIPMRLIILLHEYIHWRNNTRIELECDFNAINLLLKMGFPKTEIMYAFTKVFKGKEHLEGRVEKIYNFIHKFPDLNKC